MADPAVSVVADPKSVPMKAPEAPPEEKKADQAPTDLKKGPEKAVPPAEKASESPAAGEKAPEKPPEDLSDPKRILFDLELEDGTIREITAADAAQAVSLTDKAIQVIDENKSLKKQFDDLGNRLVKSPLVEVLRIIAARAFDGDTEAAYEHLMTHIEAAHQEREDFNSLPPEKQIEIRMGRKLKIREEKLRKIQEEKDLESKSSSRAEHLSKIKKTLDAAVVEFNLPDSDEARFLLAKAIRKQRDAGRRVNIAEAASAVQAIFEKREEALLKKTPIERLRKVRPDLAESLEKEKLAEIKKGRELEEKKSPPTPPPEEKPVSHRVPISRM